MRRLASVLSLVVLFLAGLVLPAHADTFIVVNRAPGAPTSLTVSGCNKVCAPLAVTGQRVPTLTAFAADPDHNPLRYDFEVYRGHTGRADPAARVAAASIGRVRRGVPASWALPAALAGDGRYEYRVRAFDGRTYGPWAIKRFLVDTAGPQPVRLSATGPVSTDPDSFRGVVGVSRMTVTIRPADTGQVWAYYIHTGPIGQAMFMDGLKCNTTVLDYQVICPATLNATITLTYIPQSTATALTVWTQNTLTNKISKPSSIRFFAGRG